MRSPTAKILFTAAIAAFLFVAGGTVHAANITWTGGGANANWNTTGNWSTGAVPGSSDIAIFNSTCASNCSPTINTAVNVAGININAAAKYYATGTVGTYAGYFNGYDDYFQVTSTAIAAAAQPFTLTVWFKAGGPGTILSETGQAGAINSGWHDSWLEVLSDGSVKGRVWNCGAPLLGTTTWNTWNQVVLTYTSTTLSGYLNGVAGASVACSRQSPGATEYLNLGPVESTRLGPAGYFQGAMDDFRIYNRVLSSGEVSTLYSGGAVTSSLIGEWNFENNANDTSGSGSSNAGTWYGTPALVATNTNTITQSSGNSITVGGSGFTMSGTSFYTTGTVGSNAAYFDGTTNGVSTGYTLGGRSTFSVSLWVKTTDLVSNGTFWQRPTLFGKASSGGSSGDFGITTSGGYIGFWSGLNISGDTSFLSASTSIADNNWHLVTASDNGTSVTLYVDGVLQASLAAGLNLDNSEPFGIGARFDDQASMCGYGGGCYFQGAIDDVRFYTSALTQTDVQNIYAGSPPATNLLAEWNFENNTSDSTGNGYTGAWYGVPTAGGSGWTFTGSSNASDTITVNGSFTQHGGTFTSTAGKMTIAGSALSLYGGTFNANGGSILMSHPWTVNQTVSCTGSPFNSITSYGDDRMTVTVEPGCNFLLPSGAVTNGNFINYGTITSPGGTWDNSDGTNNLLNYGTINVTGTNWILGGLVNEIPSSTVTYSGTAITNYRDLYITTGTWPGGKNVTFTHYWAWNEVVACNGSPFGTVGITGDQRIWMTVNPGCTIDLGTNPTTAGAIANYGTIIVDSGTWTAGNQNGNTQNYGTITNNGTGWSWNGSAGTGLVQENASATVTYAGTAMTFAGDLYITSGTFPASVNVTFQHIWGANQILACNGSPLGVVSITGDQRLWFTLNAGCSINLGTNPSTAGAFKNYGTMTIASGTWTGGSQAGDSQNYGTITHNGTGWSWTDAAGTGLIQEYATSTVTYAGTSITLSGDLDITTGSFPTGLNVRFYHEWSWSQYLACNGSPFNVVSIGAGGDQRIWFTLNAGCTIHLGTNPSSTGAFVNHGTMIVDGGTWTAGNQNGDSQNWGTITHNGTGWMWNTAAGTGLIQETATATVTYAGTAMTFSGDLYITSGTFPTGQNITFNHEWGSNQVVACNGSPFGTVSITGDARLWLTINPGCTIDLGANPNTAGAFANYGTIIVDSGTWTAGNANGDSLNYGTITHNGSGWNWNGGAGTGLINEYTTSSVSYAGTSITVAGDWEMASGTSPSGKNLEFLHEWAANQTLICGTSTTFQNFLVDGDSRLATIFGNNCTFTGDVNITSGVVNNPAASTTITVYGNYLQSNGTTMGGANLTISMGGTPTSTILLTSGTFNSIFAVNKATGSTVQLGNDFTVTGQPCNIVNGTFDITNRNFTCGAITVSSGGWLSDYATSASTLTVATSVVNNGVIFFDGSGGSCGTSTLITIFSSAAGTQRSWSGTGEFAMRYTKVQDQAGTASIIDQSGVNLGNNGANWNFGNSSQGPFSVQSSTIAVSGANATQLTLSSLPYTPKSGDLILVAVAYQGQDPGTAFDNASNTYALVGSAAFTNAGVTNYISLYYANNIVSTSSFSVTVTGSGGVSGKTITAAAYEFTGAAASTTLDAYAVNSDSSDSLTAITTGNAQGNSNSELYFGITTIDHNTSLTPGSGWTALPTIQTNGTQQGLYPEYQIIASPSSSAAIWTSNVSTSFASIIGVFKAPGAGAGVVATNGVLDSATFDTGVPAGVQLNYVQWQGIQPAGTTVDFQIAVSNSANPASWNFVGPDGSSATYFTGNAGTAIPLSSQLIANGYTLFNGYRYFRYRVLLFADSQNLYTPVVNQVVVNWSP